MFQKIIDWWLSTEEHASPYQEALLKLQRSLSPGIEVYGSISKIEVYIVSIDEYIKFIRRAIHCLENEEFFYHPPEAIGLKVIRKKSFYLSKEGEYLDVDIVHKEFTSNARYLLELYERKTEEPTRTAASQNNIFRILPIIDNLTSLANQLSDDLP